jgi:hypothetical protein
MRDTITASPLDRTPTIIVSIQMRIISCMSLPSFQGYSLEYSSGYVDIVAINVSMWPLFAGLILEYEI